jgi:hypothetical protein
MTTVSPLFIDAAVHSPNGAAWSSDVKLNWSFTDGDHEVYVPAFHGVDNSVKVNRITNVWSDHGSTHPTSVVEETIDGVVYIALYYDNPNPLLAKYLKPTVASWISTAPPPEEPPTGTEGDDVSAKAEIIPTGGQILTSHVYFAWDNVTHLPTSDFTNDVVIYRQYSVSGYSSHSRYNFTYTQSTKTWSHSSGNPSDDYFPWSLNSVDSHLTSTATVYNPETLFGYTDTGGLYFKFTNPWYEPPPPPPPPPPPIFVPRSARRGNLNFW